MRTLQSGLTRVYGWPSVILLFLTAKKVIDDRVNKIKQYFISHSKIVLKSPKFETFKAEESKPLMIIKNIKTRKSLVLVNRFCASSILRIRPTLLGDHIQLAYSTSERTYVIKALISESRSLDTKQRKIRQARGWALPTS